MQPAGLSSPEHLSLKSSLVALTQGLSELGQVSGKTILDVGSGSMSWKEFFTNRGANYVGVDVNEPNRPHAVMRAERLAVASGSCDIVICIAVLEHVALPQQALEEMTRVLRPTGRLVLQTHGIYPYHPDPEDHWRWTHTGLKKLVERAGLQVKSIHPSGSSLTTYIVLHILAVDILLRRLRLVRWIRLLIIPLLNLLGTVALSSNWFRPKTTASDPGSLILSYAIVAQKPVDSPPPKRPGLHSIDRLKTTYRPV